jgi:hypothetical protein
MTVSKVGIRTLIHALVDHLITLNLLNNRSFDILPSKLRKIRHTLLAQGGSIHARSG